MGEEIQEIKTVKITEKGQICIPSDARTNGFQEGSKISVIVDNTLCSFIISFTIINSLVIFYARITFS